MTEPGLFELPQKYLDLQAEASARASRCRVTYFSGSSKSAASPVI